MGVAIALLMGVIWQFRPPPQPPPLPINYRRDMAVWLGIEWVMEPHSESEILALTRDMQRHGVTHVFTYVSYLKADDRFNQTYEYAVDFTRRFHEAAPEITLLGWIGVPMQITTPQGDYLDNRLEDFATRQIVADFSEQIVNEHGFDGVHLNAELIPNDDPHLIETLQMIRWQLPDHAQLSIAAHALRLTEAVTLIPYPIIGHHWTPDYLRDVAENVDQIALMAYDSGLFFPADYCSWVAYQVRSSADALKDTDINFLIGVPTSEEWTLSHQVPTEYLANALYGFTSGLMQTSHASTIDGLSVYPYWETDENEWAILNELS